MPGVTLHWLDVPGPGLKGPHCNSSWLRSRKTLPPVLEAATPLLGPSGYLQVPAHSLAPAHVKPRGQARPAFDVFEFLAPAPDVPVTAPTFYRCLSRRYSETAPIEPASSRYQQEASIRR